MSAENKQLVGSLALALGLLFMTVECANLRGRVGALESHTCPCEAPPLEASPFDLDEHLPAKGSLEDLVRKLQDDGKTGVVR